MGKSEMRGRKKLLLFLLLGALVILAAVFLSVAKEEADMDERFTMSSNAERVEFLNKQGWIVSPDPVVEEEITIPSEFNELYKEYAALQAAQGFSLEKHMGEDATLYSYKVLNYPNYTEGVVANLIISDDKLIAGEVTLNEENGFTEPLIRDSQMVSPLPEETAESSSETTIPSESTTQTEETTVSADE